jgi:hypothetical protein
MAPRKVRHSVALYGFGFAAGFLGFVRGVRLGAGAGDEAIGSAAGVGVGVGAGWNHPNRLPQIGSSSGSVGGGGGGGDG